MSDWEPRPGMPPSPNELLTLIHLTQRWVARGTWGVDIYDVHTHIHNWPHELPAWRPSLSTVRSHVRRLIIKGHVQENRHVHGARGGLVWYAPTDVGRLALLDHFMPHLSQRP